MKKGIVSIVLLGTMMMTQTNIYGAEIKNFMDLNNKIIEQKQRIANQKEIIDKEKKLAEEQLKLEENNKITISFAGDCTLGTYYGQGEWNRFDKIAEKNGYEYFFKNVKPYFEKDDLTVVNLEGPLTTGGQRAQKQFAIKGEPSYTEILKQGSIEAVSLANNHTSDYGNEGMKQTKDALTKANINYFIGNKINYQEIKGIKIALIGETGWDKSKGTKDRIKKRIQEAKAQADLVFIMFHWGIERENYPNDVQKELAYLSIDEGADLVLGSHPHVIQGIETYKGKDIIYSFGNFSFGANKNPDDKDTFIYQVTYKKQNGKVVLDGSQVIPCSISSTKERNTYQPTPLAGAEKERVQNRLIKYSNKLTKSYFN